MNDFLEYIYTINLTNAMYDKGQGGAFRTAAPPGPGMLPENVMKGYGRENLERSIAEMMADLNVGEGLQELGTFLTKTVRSKGRGRAPRVVGHLDGLTVVFPASLRVIDSLKLTIEHKVATPANWKQGEDVIIVPAVKDEEAKKLFPDGWNAIKPYLRKVPDPSK